MMGLGPDAILLLASFALDLVVGDPVYRWHPIRLMGRTISHFERWLRRTGRDGRAGGCALVATLGVLWTAAVSVLVAALYALHPTLGMSFHALALYSLLALGDLIKHGDAVDEAGSRLDAARRTVGRLVGRDTDRMDEAACRRAAIESLAENLTDGFTSPLVWYVAAGLPGVVLFKLVSTVDSMIGHKTDRYLRLGWFGARSDDVLNYVPARLTWLLIALTAAVLPGTSGLKALRIGWKQHAVVPGPNPGWSEAAMAGAIRRRLCGPIWLGDDVVTDRWLGDPADPQAGSSADYRRARQTVMVASLLAALLAAGLLS